ncbi:unnamed protein product, partial [Polarella glacialis]
MGHSSSGYRRTLEDQAEQCASQETAHGRCQSGRKPRLNDASRRLQALLGALSLGTFASLRPRSSPCTPFAVGFLSSASASASSSGPGRQRWPRLRGSATSRLRPEEPRRPERCPESLGACLGGRRLASAPQVSLVRAHGITVGTSALSQTKDENPAFAVFLELFVHSTLWMSFCLASLVPFVQLECAAQLDWQPFWAAACESVSVYTLDHLRDIRKATASTGSNKRPLNQGGLARHRRTFLRVLLGAGLAGFVGSLLAARSWRVTLTFGGHILLCFAYAKLKKSMPYLKAFYVSLCVLFMAVAAPSAYAPSLLTALSAGALLRMLVLIFSVAFTVEHLQDLRDVREDREAGVVTLPSGLGPSNARRLLVAIQAACLLAHFMATWLDPTLPLRLELFGVHALCGLCAVFFRSTTRHFKFQ